MTWIDYLPDPSHVFCTTAAFTARKHSSGAGAIIYGASASMVVNIQQLTGPYVQARWYDPTTGLYTNDSASPILASSGPHTFAAHGNNAGGGNDWVLRLDSVNTTWPNEPTGWTVLTDQDCSVISNTGFWHAYSPATLVDDATAPLSPTKVWEAPYPIGFGGGIGPINMAYETLSPKIPSIYVGTWWKPSNPWQGHSSGTNKILYIYFTMPSDNVFIKLRGDPNALGPFNTGMISEAGHPIPGWDNRAYDENVGSTHPLALGVWHQLEILVLASGTLKWWVDNVLIGNYTGQTWPSGIESVRWNPTWGGLGDSKSENDYYRFDHIRISKP